MTILAFLFMLWFACATAAVLGNPTKAEVERQLATIPLLLALLGPVALLLLLLR